VAPLAFLRGRSLNDSFIILDEAQNTTPEQMKMFLTRLGFGSRIVVTGDVTQVDLPGGVRSGLRVVEEILTGVEDLSFNPPTGYTGASLGGLAAIDGGLNSSGCNGTGNFFCFDGVHEAVNGSTMSLDFTITASSFEGYVPHLKVDWNGSENNYNLVSTNMVAAVPEPETYAMFLAGLGAMGFVARRRQKLQHA